MSGSTYVSPTAPLITSTGITAPSYDDVVSYFTSKVQAIYGGDIYLGNDSQDDEMLGIFALAVSDANSACLACYNSFSPSTAQSDALSVNVKINGIARLIPSNSTVDLLLVGQVGKPILNGIVTDENNNAWVLPPSITFPSEGQITVTATAAVSGAITAAPGTVTGITTPQQGWQSATNAAAANPGQPVEGDGTLRQRQSASTMLPSTTVLDGIAGAIESIENVTRVAPYQNATGSTDSNSAPAHSLYMVVEGGDVNAIASVIALKKTLGAPTYGTTTINVVDSRGGTDVINFFVSESVPITVVIHVATLTGYISSDGTAAGNAVAAAIQGGKIGGSVIVTQLYGPAYSPNIGTYDINSILIAASGSPGSSNVAIAFNQAATCDPDTNVTIVVDS